MTRRNSEVTVGPDALPGVLSVPSAAHGLVIFAHGSGSSRLSPRNVHVAERLQAKGFATLLFDLLTQAESADRRNVFDIPLLARRVVDAIDWAASHAETGDLPIGLFGASTGGGAALVAAAARRDLVRAVVSRGGRPDLAGEALEHVDAPTLLIVGGADVEVIELNTAARRRMRCETALRIVPRAGHLFEEPGALDQVIAHAGAWFTEHLKQDDLAKHMQLPFRDRTGAGRLLAAAVKARAPANPVVYALPRGGAPVAYEVAKALQAPLDLILVRKIGAPWNPEFAVGSVVDGAAPDIVMHEDVMRRAGVSREQFDAIAKRELHEIERRRAHYLPGRSPVSAEGRTAILVDDGVATGASMMAAIAAIRKRKPARVIVAAPVAAPETAAELRGMVDDVVFLATPARFQAVGLHYRDFDQLTDREVMDCLQQAAADETARDSAP